MKREFNRCVQFSKPTERELDFGETPIAQVRSANNFAAVLFVQVFESELHSKPKDGGERQGQRCPRCRRAESLSQGLD